jgi:hypothetical protein
MSQKIPQKKFNAGWLLELDGRTAICQEMRERYIEFTDDLGGRKNLSYAKRSLVERVLWLEYWLTTQELALAKGEEFDVARWTQAANSLQGILSKLGLERQVKQVPSLHEYIATKVIS